MRSGGSQARVSKGKKQRNISREYWGKPEATAKEFTSDGWFRTGDTSKVRGQFTVLNSSLSLSFMICIKACVVCKTVINSFIDKTHDDYDSIYSLFSSYNKSLSSNQQKTSIYDLQDTTSVSGAKEGIVDSHTCLFINPDHIDLETIQDFFDSDDDEFVIEHYYVFQVSFSILPVELVIHLLNLSSISSLF